MHCQTNRCYQRSATSPEPNRRRIELPQSEIANALSFATAASISSRIEVSTDHAPQFHSTRYQALQSQRTDRIPSFNTRRDSSELLHDHALKFRVGDALALRAGAFGLGGLRSFFQVLTLPIPSIRCHAGQEYVRSLYNLSTTKVPASELFGRPEFLYRR